MKKVITALTVLLGFASAMPTALCAQDPYDDLYYSPSKAAKQKKEQEKKLKEAIEAQTYNYTTVPTADYPAADTYSAGSSKPLNVDVDAYNRRYASTTAAAADTAMQEEFAYTRRIERYHNPDVVTASGDTDLIEYYYNTPDRTDVNIYIVNQDPWAWNTPWSYYNPYYWGPRWSFGWGYNPWFDYGWGWGCGWHDPWHYPAFGWGPSWGPSCGPGWYPPRPPHGVVAPPRPGGWASSSPGASRPHRPATGIGTTNRRPGSNTGSITRPGNNGRPSQGWRPASGSTGNYRPSAPASGNNYLAHRRHPTARHLRTATATTATAPPRTAATTRTAAAAQATAAQATAAQAQVVSAQAVAVAAAEAVVAVDANCLFYDKP